MQRATLIDNGDNPRLTRAGAIVGTAPYMAPEQCRGEEVDLRADIYAFGATLYHLLTNEPPVDARKRFLQPSSLRPPREFNPSLSARTEQAILWAMALHPDERPNTISIFSEYLFGSGKMPSRPYSITSAFDIPRLNIFGNLADMILLWVTVGLVLLSLIVTLIH